MADVSGFDELYNLIEDLEINDGQEQRILKQAKDIMVEEYKNSAPVRTGYIKNSVKGSIGTDDEGQKCAKAKVTAWDALFTTEGTSKVRKYVGWDVKAENNMEEKITKMVIDNLDL